MACVLGCPPEMLPLKDRAKGALLAAAADFWGNLIVVEKNAVGDGEFWVEDHGYASCPSYFSPSRTPAISATSAISAIFVVPVTPAPPATSVI